MKSFQYHIPTEIAFGADTTNRIAELVTQYGGKRVLLVYGSERVVRNGLVPKIQGLLVEAGLFCAAFSGVQPNPLLSRAEEGVRQAIYFAADFIVALGGGSVIDTAKGIALGAANPKEKLWDLWTGQRPFETVLPVGAVVTIPAAGSEMGNLAVLTHDELHAKRVFGAPQFRPKFAIMDPTLCAKLPPYQVACGVTDILMHTLERYFSPVLGNVLTDEIAEGLMRTVVRYGAAAVEDPGNYEAMSELMWCGSLSNCDLTGLGGIPDFATHELGHELSAQFGVAHGASMAVIWPAWARSCVGTNSARFAQYARTVWEVDEPGNEMAALAGIQATEAYFDLLNMPVCFSSVEGMGVLDADGIDALTQGCLHGGERSSIGAFRQLDRGDITQIYMAANH